MSDFQETLAHYGIKGMKWGVRNDKGHEGERAKNTTIAKLDTKFDRKKSTPQMWAKLHNKAADKMNSYDISRINEKPHYKAAADRGDFMRDTGIRRQYYKEMQVAYLKNLEDAAAAEGTNASGTKRYGIIEGQNGAWGVTLKDVKHADEPEPEFWVTPKKDHKGYILSVELGQPNESGELAHYGVKGMKWGVRRERSAVDVSVKAKPGRRVRTRGGQLHTPSEDAIRAARSRQIARRSTIDALSNKELQDLVNRMGMEDRYAQLMKSDHRVGAGKMIARNLLREFDGDLVTELATDVAGAVGKPLSSGTQAKIHLGTTMTRIAFGVKGGQSKKQKKKKSDNE